MKKTYHIAVLALGLSLFGCGGGSGGGGGSADTTAPALLTQNPAGRLIQPDTGITLRFDESIDTTSFTLSGDLAAESDDGVWSQTDVIDDTLTLTPTSNWSVDTGRTLVINVSDLAGNKMAELTISHDVYNGTLYYVDSNRPDDSGDGLSPASARRFIHSAVADATAPATILVAAGDYRLSSALDTQVKLRDQVSLYGGYNADFNRRDPATYISRIEDMSTAQGTYESPSRAIEGDGSVLPITASTIVDGFTIQGSVQTDSMPTGHTYHAAIVLNNDASPTVQHNTINGGGGNQVSSYRIYTFGMHNSSSSPLVQHNTINGGSANNNIGMYNSSSSPLVEHNTINGGSANSTVGMHNSDSSALVQHNTINGGSGSTVLSSCGIYNKGYISPHVLDNTIDGGSGSSTSCGMSLSFSYSIVQRNTINGGSGGHSSYGMRISGGSTPNVHNNTIDGGSGNRRSYGIYNESFTSPLVQHNTIDGGSGFDDSYGIYNDSSSPDVLANTIDGGSGVLSYAMYNRDISSPFVINNILHTRSGADGYCLYEHYLNDDPRALYDNQFVACEVLYRDEGTIDIIDIDSVNALTEISASGNTYSETLTP